MKIGELVKQNIKKIFYHCETEEHEGLTSLFDLRYSKRTFGINFPFCTKVENIEPTQSKRYWSDVYLVRGNRVRVTSQWFEASREPFLAYLRAKGIVSNGDVANSVIITEKKRQTSPLLSSRANSRFRGNAIGNAQNLFVRNILSSIGSESFNELDWIATKKHFAHKCAYCGAEEELLMEHAVPINKEKLGEHRLGNLVPSCKTCNANKSNKDYREYLADNTEAIDRIEQYMDSRNYVPLEDNDQMKMLLNMAHREVASLADRYIAIVNEWFANSPI